MQRRGGATPCNATAAEALRERPHRSRGAAEQHARCTTPHTIVRMRPRSRPAIDPQSVPPTPQWLEQRGAPKSEYPRS
eukprot:15444083-Alexandrium_andersonii.AAC.1